jgi:hypothetical protein
VVHSSGDSATDQRDLREYDDIEEGVFCNNDGACWEIWSAKAGGRCAGGCSRAEDIVPIIVVWICIGWVAGFRIRSCLL